MTQGEEEQQHSRVASVSSAHKVRRQPGAQNGVESNESTITSSSFSLSSPSSVIRVCEMEQMPPEYPRNRKQHPTSSDGGDVKTLLHFVNLASDDIKAALDNSSSSTSTMTKVDTGHVMSSEHEQLSSEDGHMSVTQSPKSLPSDKIDTLFDFRYLGNSVAQNADDTRGKTCAVAPVSVNAVDKLDRNCHETKSFKPDMLIMDVPLKEHLQMSSCGFQGDTKVNFDKSLFDKRGGHGDSSKPHGLISPFCEEKKKGSLNDNPVPLRKRQLPASFWQEPGKSENHKTSPSSINTTLNFPGNISPTAASQSFKMPMLSPLTLPHSNDARLGNSLLSEKGFLYSNSGVANNTDACCSNLGLSFHYANSSLPVTPCMDSLQHRSMALSCGSLCSCHLNNMNNNNYFYEHHHNHGMYPRSQGEFSSLLNSAAVAAAAAASGAPPSSPLSRWHHHPPSLHNDSREICHHTLPRVLKPIPTKTMSSYPPRFHPIFT